MTEEIIDKVQGCKKCRRNAPHAHKGSNDSSKTIYGDMDLYLAKERAKEHKKKK